MHEVLPPSRMVHTQQIATGVDGDTTRTRAGVAQHGCKDRIRRARSEFRVGDAQFCYPRSVTQQVRQQQRHLICS